MLRRSASTATGWMRCAYPPYALAKDAAPTSLPPTGCFNVPESDNFSFYLEYYWDERERVT